MGLYRVGAGLFIADEMGRFLLLKRSEDTSYPLTWSVAGGSMEKEDCDNLIFPKDEYKRHEFLACAIREVREETALNFENIKFRTLSTIITDSSIYTYKYTTFVIMVDNLEDLIGKIDLDLNENIDFKIFSFEETNSLIRHNEKDKKIVYNEDSIHPGLYDVIERIRYEIIGHTEKPKQ